MLILVMASINFVNLATARAGQRAREVALRKVLGATRRQLIVQFLAESVMITAVAMLIALALAELALPYISKLPRPRTFAGLSRRKWRAPADAWIACARRHRRWAVSGRLFVAVPARRGSSRQPIRRRTGRKRQPAQPPGHCPVRDFHRADHLHRNRLCPDPLPAKHRPRVSEGRVDRHCRHQSRAGHSRPRGA